MFVKQKHFLELVRGKEINWIVRKSKAKSKGIAKPEQTTNHQIKIML